MPRTAKRTRRRWPATAVLLALPAIAIASGYTLDWQTTNGAGGGHSAGGGWKLDGTVAQPAPGASSGGGFTLQAGFWTAAPVVSDLIFQGGFEND